VIFKVALSSEKKWSKTKIWSWCYHA